MEFDNNKSIFLQIADTITEKVVSGVYPPGEKIPSVRELAAGLGVNPNTIMRTYNELQTASIIENRRGIGYFVNPKAQKLILERKRSEFYSKVLPAFLRQASLLGITSSDLKKHLDQLNHETA
ncbi:MAG: GntR family transcriptional regulator [Cyclobacteriaceae bacterium]